MAIEHKRLGNHGVLVSHICLGTMNFGWHTTQEESFKDHVNGSDLPLRRGEEFADVSGGYGASPGGQPGSAGLAQARLSPKRCQGTSRRPD